VVYTDEEAELGICADCIDEKYFKKIILSKGVGGICDNCDSEKVVLTLSEFADYINVVFENYYTFGETNRFTFDQDGELPESIIEEILSLDFQYCEIIRNIIAENFADYDSYFSDDLPKFGEDVHYVPIELDWHNLHHDWRIFEKTIREKARFFGGEVREYLDKTFKDIDELSTHKNNSVLMHIGPGTDWNTFFRGRYFHDEGEILRAMERPDLNIGPPPSEFASAGRMNAKGISVFYGATNPEVALAEIRPPVGSSVVIGEFNLVKPLRVLNLSLLEDIVIDGSMFDPEHLEFIKRVGFLKSLVNLMSRPTNPLKEAEYLPTQVIAEYLANAYPENIDGILYPSSQSKKDGQNVVLFNHASKLVPLDIPEGTKYMSGTYDVVDEHVIEDHYYVTELAPEKMDDVTESKKRRPFRFPKFNEIDETDKGNLTINPERLVVHIVKPIEIHTNKHEVERSRISNFRNPF